MHVAYRCLGLVWPLLQGLCFNLTVLVLISPSWFVIVHFTHKPFSLETNGNIVFQGVSPCLGPGWYFRCQSVSNGNMNLNL